MSYMNDPREMAIRPESGVTLEQDNRVETMYHWGAMVVDLCDLPVEEYMKPMTVNVSGISPSGITPDVPVVREDIKILASVTEENGEWNGKVEWIGDFEGQLKVSLTTSYNGGSAVDSAIISDSSSKVQTFALTVPTGAENVALSACGVGSAESSGAVTSSTYDYKSIDEKTAYYVRISDDASIISFNLYYYLNGSKVQSEKVKRGDPLPPYTGETQVEGYDFSGWADKSGNTHTTMPEENLSLYATLVIEKFVVTFDLDGEVSTLSNVNYGTVLRANQFPSTAKTGYDFLGWVPDSATPITADTTFVGSYEVQKFNLTWDINGVQTVERLEYGAPIDYPSEVDTPEGYSFSRWSGYTGATMPRRDITIIAVYTINSYVLSFVIQDESGATELFSSASVVYGRDIQIPAVPTMAGYSFSQWDSTYEGQTMPSHDVEYISQKTRNTYVLAYFVDGDFLDSANYKFKDVVTKHAQYTKTGYNVTPWQNEPDTMPANNVSATCETSIKTAVVTFTDYNGAIVSAITADYGTPVADILPEKTGYVFEPESGSPEMVGEQDITIRGEFEANKHSATATITDISGSTSVVVINNISYGEDIVETISEYLDENYPLPAGYHYDVETGGTMPDEDINVNVRVAGNVWELSYAVSGEVTASGSVMVEYGDTFVEELGFGPRTGLDFSGWFDDNGNVVDVNTTMPDYDYDIYSSYAVKRLNVTVNNISGSTLFSTVVDYGTEMSEVYATPTVSDYVTATSAAGFTVSWDKSGSYVITADTIVNAQATPNTYVLTFTDEGDPISSYTMSFGAAITYPVLPDITEGGKTYTFKWDGEIISTMPNYNLTINGQYVQVAGDVYYGFLKSDGVVRINTMKTFPVADAATGVGITLTVSGSSEYAEMWQQYDDGDITQEEWDEFVAEWERTQWQDGLLLVPESLTAGTTTTVTEPSAGSKTLVDGGIVNINGFNYRKYTFSGAFTPSDVDRSYNFTVTIN